MVSRTLAGLGSLILGLFLQGMPSLVSAHDFGGSTSGGTQEPDDPPPPCSIDRPCRCPGENAESAEPINYWNGRESFTVTDLVVGGKLPIEITRRYDSQSDFDSPLGYGWAFDHERFLYEYPDGSVIIRLSCGVRERFVASGGTYQSPSGGVLGSLVQKPDGSFELSYADGARDYFDSQGRLIAAQSRRGDRHEYTYDSRGKLPLTGTSRASVDPSAPMVVAHNHRLTRIDERAANGALTGRHVIFSYDETTGRLTTVTANDGRSVSYQHDSTAGLTRGNLVQVNGLDGAIATYGYLDPNDQHNVTSITKAVGRTPIINTYNNQDLVIRQEEGTRKIEFNYQIPLAKTVITRTIKDQNGLNAYTAVETYEFDATGRTTKRIDALGNEVRYTYNAVKDLTRKEIWQKNGTTLALLQAANFTYDTAGHKLTESVTLDTGEVVTRTWTYDHDWVQSEQSVSSVTPAKIFRTEYTFFYDGEGRPKAIESKKRRRDDGSFQTTSYTYDARNRLLTTTLPDGVKVVNEYTGDYLTKTYFEVGGSEIPQLARRFEYDDQGNQIKRWDARNNLTELEYDDRGRVISVTNPLGEQALYVYADDLLTQVEAGLTAADAEGQVRKFNYDSRGRLISIQRKNDAGVFQPFETYELDSEGQRLSITDAVGRKTTFAYDTLRRAVSVTDPLNKVTQFSYDAAGNRVSVTDALGRVTTYEYDDLNRVVAMVQLGVTPNPRTEYAYDAMGSVISVNDPEGHTTSYEFDALSRNTRVIQPLGQVVEHVYDSRNRKDYTITARAQKLDYAYEPWGPVKEEKQFPTTGASTPDRAIAYAYDNDGNLTSVLDDGVQATPVYTMTFDVLGRPYDETIKYVPGGDRVLNHRYDRFGNRKELTLQDGTAITHTYTYNKLNQLAAADLAGAAIVLTHYANDDRQSITLPGGVSRALTYKANGPIDVITVSGPLGQIAQFAYTYDDVLNLAEIADPDGAHDYGYDGLNRLVTAVRPTGLGLANESYSYDRVGNREDPANSALYGYDGNNRITASPGLTYTFDADGNLVSRSDGATFTYDARNRLVAYSKASTNASYLQEPRGRRIRKTVNGTATWFLWDGNRLLAEYSAAGVRQQRYAYLGSDYAPIQMEDANGTYFVTADHLDTPRLVTDSTSQVVWKARHQAFGTTIAEADPDGNSVPVVLNLRFPGQYEDQESGLHYNYFRDYDPAAGRYIESDPIGLNGGVNTYAYVEGSPVDSIDPEGLVKFRWRTCNAGEVSFCRSWCQSVIGRPFESCRARVGFRMNIDTIDYYNLPSGLSCSCQPPPEEPVPAPAPAPAPEPAPTCGENCKKGVAAVGAGVLAYVIIKKCIGAGLLFTPAAPVGGVLLVTP
jgi:RHS repeat-associated protein